MAKDKRKMTNMRQALDRVGGADLAQQFADRDARNERIELRVTASERKTIKKLAETCGVSVTTLLVRLAEIAASGTTETPKGRRSSRRERGK